MSALQQEVHARSMAMLQGVQAFQRFTPSDEMQQRTPHQTIWRKANAQLIDYGGDANAPAVLCVPSLINKHYILDLYPKRSMVRYLRDQGFRVLVLNWNSPGLRERRYNCADYVAYLLLDAIDMLRKNHAGALHLLGYCMGGVFALAAAQLRPQALSSLTLLATPWNFSHAPHLPPSDWERFQQHIMQQDTLPAIATETLFHLLDPWRFQEKFGKFTSLTTAQQQHFAAVEDWANDGVALSRYVAQDCYIKWPRHNFLAEGLWRIGGQNIAPQHLTYPSLVVTPSQDNIVPLCSSAPLAEIIPNAQRLQPKCGHVSMVIGAKAKSQLWNPLAQWLSAHS